MEQSQIKRIKEKLEQHARYLNDEVGTHTDIAKRFSTAKNKEKFFHAGAVAKATGIGVNFNTLFAEELKKSNGRRNE